jgi:hypothetical protein
MALAAPKPLAVEFVERNESVAPPALKGEPSADMM